MNTHDIWQALRTEAEALLRSEPVLVQFLERLVLMRSGLGEALTVLLPLRLSSLELDAQTLRILIYDVYRRFPELIDTAARDLAAANERDPASLGLLDPFVNHKGFHALQVQRVANTLWHDDRRFLALQLHGLSSRAFGIEIHPAASMGAGIFIDHGTGVVIGETAVVGDDVSMLQGVTLGGTGKETGDRHPKVGRGVLLSADATVLGNIQIGDGAKVGAGSVVLDDVPAHSTVVGVPGRVIGRVRGLEPGLTMDHDLGSA